MSALRPTARHDRGGSRGTDSQQAFGLRRSGGNLVWIGLRYIADVDTIPVRAEREADNVQAVRHGQRSVAVGDDVNRPPGPLDAHQVRDKFPLAGRLAGCLLLPLHLPGVDAGQSDTGEAFLVRLDGFLLAPGDE